MLVSGDVGAERLGGGMTAREDAEKALARGELAAEMGWPVTWSEVTHLHRVIRALLAETEPEWEYGAGYFANNGIEDKWFSMESSGFTIREAAERAVERYADSQITLIRRRKAGDWEAVPDGE